MHNLQLLIENAIACLSLVILFPFYLKINQMCNKLHTVKRKYISIVTRIFSRKVGIQEKIFIPKLPKKRYAVIKLSLEK